MLRVLEVTLPVFALVFCGFFGQRWQLLPARAVQGINAFVFFFALPAMLFRVVATQKPASFSDGRFAGNWPLSSGSWRSRLPPCLPHRSVRSGSPIRTCRR